MVDLASLMLLMSFFGAKIAIAYVVVGLILAVIGGTLIEKLRLEKYVQGYVREIENTDTDFVVMSRDERISYSKDQVKDIIHRVWLYVLIGVGIGAILSFMMAVTALSLPSMIMPSKVVKPKLLVIFVFIVSAGIIIIGYLFNAFSYIFV
nr:permease [Calorimonas adulescens]